MSRVSYASALLFCFLAQHASAATYVAPPRWANVDGANGGGDIRHTVRIQSIYAGSLFTNTGPMVIQEIRYRPSSVIGSAFTSSIPDIRLNLSTTTANPEGLSSTFANNRGPNDTLVFQGPITLSSHLTGPPGGPKAFDIVFPLQTPFLYDPSAGNLLIELRNFSNNTEAYLDVAAASDNASRMFSVDPNAITGAADTAVDVVQLVYIVPSSARVITAHPQGQSAPLGSTVTFNVSAYGSQPLFYQWSQDGTNLLNATNASLTLSNVGFSNEGTYRVVITNVFGQATSSNAVLDVYAVPPGITSQPQNQRAPLGSSAAFAVVAAGSPPLSYQWTFNGNDIPNATNATLSLDNVALSDAGAYRVTITNLYGQTTSTIAYLEVYEIVASPVLTERPGPSSRRTGLVISEIMYHPPDRADGRNIEYIEIHNAGAAFQKLDGFRLSGSVDFSFPGGTTLAADARLVVAANRTDVQSVYGVGNVIGNFTNNLPNDNGTVRLRNNQGAVLLEVNYTDSPPWPVAPDGGGHSLILARPSLGEGSPFAWKASVARGGSPGTIEPLNFDPRNNIVFNEILVHNDDPSGNFIELNNHGRTAVNLSGCFLTDDPATNKFRLPDGTTLNVGGLVAFSQVQMGFALDPTGGRLFLINSNNTHVIDAIRYQAQARNVAFGRSPDGAGLWSELSQPSGGTSNSVPLRRDIVINEIMYRPISGLDDDEFVELHNRGSNNVNIGGWRFVEGIDFTFPPNTIMPARGYLVLAKNASRLRTNYPWLGPTDVAGDFDGALAERGERLTLAMPQVTTNLSNGARVVSYVAVDEVTYSSGGRWPKWARGGGASLELIDPNSDNRLPSNWADSAPPTNAPWTTIEYTGPHEFWDGNSPLNGFEMSLLGEGECFVDDVEVRSGGGANQIGNPGFSFGAAGWTFDGNHDLSVTTNSGGIANSACLHIRASGRGDYLGSRVWTQWSTALSRSTPGTLRAKVRWLRGWPEVLLRLRGGSLEATGPLALPTDLGTPGRANSRAMESAGPAIFDVTHTPILPAANEAVVVSARVSDPNGVTNAVLFYRLDPSAGLAQVTLRDNGLGGDAVAGDGIYGAIIPGQSSGQLVAFHIETRDSNGGITRFPSDAPTRECLVRFGEQQAAGSFGTYRVWMTAATVNTWSSRPTAPINGRPLDVTFVYNDQRVIYNAGGAYNGSDNTSMFYDSPLNVLCGYTFFFPDEERFLGASEVLLDWMARDSTAQHEQLCYWMAGEVGLPFNYRRFVHLSVNGIGEMERPGPIGIPPSIYEDAQTPASDYLEQWYGGDSEGDLFKVQVWRRDYKFPPQPSPNSEPYHASLENFVGAGGKKHLGRYRWCWRKRAVNGSANDYDSFFELIDAANVSDANGFVDTLGAVADVEQWMRTLAFERCVGNFDSYGNRNGHNMYLFKPEGKRWDLHTFDTDLVLGSVSEGTSDNLFGTYNPPGVPGVGIPEPIITRMRGTPVFQRAYWRAFREFVNGPMAAANFLPFANSLYQALLANGVPVSGPQEFSGWIDARRSYIQSQLATVNAPFSVSFPTGVFTTNQNLLTLNGFAPIDVKNIYVNGVEQVVRWTSVTAWTLSLALTNGINNLRIEGFDRHDRPVASALANITVSMTGGIDSPEGNVIINEIMYHPALANAEFIEIFNRSATTSFDLSNWRLDGLDFDFSPGTLLRPTNYLLVARSRVGFGRAHGFNIPVAGEYNGRFATNGEMLSLTRMVGTNEVVVDAVAYEPIAPWPIAANGNGPSLQLIDAAQDNNRLLNWTAALATPGRANSVASVLPVFPLLWINEVQPNNATGAADNAGEREPWVEIYNASGMTLNLNGFYLSDNYTNLTRWAFPTDTLIGPGALRIVWLDGQLAQNTGGHLHAGFRIDPMAGSLALVSTLNNRTSVVDYLNYRLAVADQSYGSFPDGDSHSRNWFLYPTPGATNNQAAPRPSVRINEWLASNTGTLFDSTYGEFSDWFELFNPSENAVDLTGWRLSDAPGDPNGMVIPPGVIIGPRGFLLIWADDHGTFTNGQLHADFRLGRGGDDIALFDSDGILIDSVTFGSQTNDISQGRWPDGMESLYFMPTPTPSQANVIASQPEIIAVIANAARNITITWTATPGRAYRVQVKSDLADPFWTPLTGDVIADADTASRTDTLPAQETSRFYRVIAVTEN